MARRPTPPPYVELHAASAFSFLDGASLPEDLAARAAALDLPAVAVMDVNGVYGAPRFFRAARESGLRALVGAEIVLDPLRSRPAPKEQAGPLGVVAEPPPPPAASPAVT